MLIEEHIKSQRSAQEMSDIAALTLCNALDRGRED